MDFNFLTQEYPENRFEFIIRTCICDCMIDLFAPKYSVYTGEHIIKLSLCNKNLNKLIIRKLLKRTYCKMSQVQKFDIIYGRESINCVSDVNTIDDVIFLHNYQNLKYLQIGDDFDKDIAENILPKELKELTFGINFNKIICKNVLPSQITELTFGFEFNQPIEDTALPQSLKKLYFGNTFSQPINKNTLPKNLTSLSFGCYFNHSLVGVLPDSLKELSLGRYFNQTLIDVLPKELIMLKIHKIYNHHDSKKLLSSMFSHMSEDKSLHFLDYKN